VAEGSLNEGQYEMMMRNGQVKKFIAKDDADAKRIAAGHGAKSVIKLRGGVPAGKVAEQGVAEGKDDGIVINGKEVDKASLEVDGVDSRDYPDFSDAYFSAGSFTDGTPLSDEEIDQLSDQYGDLLYDKAYDSLHEGENFATFEDIRSLTKLAGIPVSENRDHAGSEYIDELVGKILALEKPGMSTDRSNDDFFKAVYDELIEIGLTPKAARYKINYDEDFVGDVASAYHHFSSHPEVKEGAAVDAYMAGKSPAVAHFADQLDKSHEVKEGSCNMTMEGEYCPEHGLMECGGMYEMGTVAGSMAPVMGENLDDRAYFVRNNIWTVMDGDEEVMQHEVESGPMHAKRLMRDLDDEGYDFTHVVSPEGHVTYLPQFDPRRFPKDELDEIDMNTVTHVINALNPVTGALAGAAIGKGIEKTVGYFQKKKQDKAYNNLKQQQQGMTEEMDEGVVGNMFNKAKSMFTKPAAAPAAPAPIVPNAATQARIAAAPQGYNPTTGKPQVAAAAAPGAVAKGGTMDMTKKVVAPAAAPTGNYDPNTGQPISDKGRAGAASTAAYNASPQGQAMDAYFNAQQAGTFKGTFKQWQQQQAQQPTVAESKLDDVLLARIKSLALIR
jgi:hypothetical protein